MSLIEVLVSGLVLVIVLTIMASFLAPGFAAWTQGDRRSQVQQQATLAVSALVREISEVPVTAVHVTQSTVFDPVLGAQTEIDELDFPSPFEIGSDTVSFASTGSGEPVLRQYVRFTVDGNWNLVSWTAGLDQGFVGGQLLPLQCTNPALVSLSYPDILMLNEPGAVLAPAANNVVRITPTPTATRVVARNVHRFMCTVTPGPRLAGHRVSINPVGVDILINDGKYEYEAQTSVQSVVSN